MSTHHDITPCMYMEEQSTIDIPDNARNVIVKYVVGDLVEIPLRNHECLVGSHNGQFPNCDPAQACYQLEEGIFIHSSWTRHVHFCGLARSVSLVSDPHIELVTNF